MTGDDQPRFQRTREALAGGGDETAGVAPGSLSDAAERIRQMLVTAEDVSEDIRREAAKEAEGYLAAARREADELVESRRRHLEEALETLRTEGREIQRRIAAVTATLERVLEDPAVTGPVAAVPEPEASEPVAAAPPPPDPEPAAPAAEPAAAPDADRSSAASAHVRQRALIRATQLAVQGVDRASIEQTLRREFELDDAGAIVDEILGE